MSKIYNINDNYIPSVEYIKEIVKMIEDSILNVSNDVPFNGFKTISTETDDIPIQQSKYSIYANEIITDANHRFINEPLLNTFINKPSKFDIDQNIEDLRCEIDEKINDMYMKIINTPDVINKLRDISNVLNEDKNVDDVLANISDKASIKQLNDHIDSAIHLNNNDRKALNIIIKLVKDGIIDWNAGDGDINSIKNKPNSLPANGGNADTISNHSIKDLINKYDESVVIGTISKYYDKDSCDIFIDKDSNISLEIIKYITKNNYNMHTLLFKSGEYIIKDFDTHSYNDIYIIKGISKKVSILDDSNITLDSIDINNLGFYNSNVMIKSNCDIDNIEFKNCMITLKNSECCNIRNCTFNNCKFIISGGIFDNIISFNRFINSEHIKFLGGNNIITNNIV